MKKSKWWRTKGKQKEKNAKEKYSSLPKVNKKDREEYENLTRKGNFIKCDINSTQLAIIAFNYSPDVEWECKQFHKVWTMSAHRVQSDIKKIKLSPKAPNAHKISEHQKQKKKYVEGVETKRRKWHRKS